MKKILFLLFLIGQTAMAQTKAPYLSSDSAVLGVTLAYQNGAFGFNVLSSIITAGVPAIGNAPTGTCQYYGTCTASQALNSALYIDNSTGRYAISVYNTSGGGMLPVGTVSGQTLSWNNTTSAWDVNANVICTAVGNCTAKTWTDSTGVITLDPATGICVGPGSLGCIDQNGNVSSGGIVSGNSMFSNSGIFVGALSGITTGITGSATVIHVTVDDDIADNSPAIEFEDDGDSTANRLGGFDGAGDFDIIGDATLTGGDLTLGTSAVAATINALATGTTGFIISSATAASGGVDTGIILRTVGDLGSADFPLKVRDNSTTDLFTVNGIGDGVATGALSAGTSVTAGTSATIGTFVVPTPQAFTIADSGNGSQATSTATPTGTSIDATCSDSDGCTWTVGETAIADGTLLYIQNVGSNDLVMVHSAGVVQLTGGLNHILSTDDAVTLRYNGGYWQQQGAIVYSHGGDAWTTAQFDSTNTTPAGITGLSLNLKARRTYSIYGRLPVTCSATAGSTIDFDGGGATVTSMSITVGIGDNTLNSTSETATVTALATDVASGSTTETDGYVAFKGVLKVNAAGTFIPRYFQKVDTGTSSVLIGADLHADPID